MKKFWVLISIMSVVFFGYAFSYEICSIDFNPVCGKKQGVCVNGQCNSLFWTYSNKCLLEQDNAIFVSKGKCGEQEQVVKNNSKLDIKSNIVDNNTEFVISDDIKKEIDFIVNSIVLKIDGKSDKVRKFYVNNFIKQINILLPKLKSEIQIKKYEIVKNRLLNLIKEKNIENLNESKEKDLNSNVDDVSNSQDNYMKPYKFSSLGIEVLVPSSWQFVVTGNQMMFLNGTDKFIISVLGKTENNNSGKEISSDVIKESGSVETQNLNTELVYTGKVLLSGVDKNQVISSYIRNNLCMKLYGGKRLASYQILKKQKPYSNVADYELMYLCQEYVKKGSSYVAKNTYSAPLRMFFLRSDGIYYLIKTEKPSDGDSYVGDVKKMFSLQNQKIFLGQDIDAYNTIVDSLLNQNKTWVDNNL